ncbi:MAG: hypothetical protein LBO21_02270, partial [Synergistaceae bacterium]|nr:hypothetical protein [Synergistaceae bacterium]
MAAVSVEGLNPWLTAGAERSLGAVYDHIPPEEPPSYKESLLKVVADKLLSGYSVRSISWTGTDVRIALEKRARAPRWKVVLTIPNLSPPVDGWFESDSRGLDAKITSLLEGVP